VWLWSRQKRLTHGKITENRIPFEIPSAIRLSWWVDALVNLSAVLFLWRFKLRVVPLSLSPSCVTHKKTSRKNFMRAFFSSRFTYGHAQLSERGNTASVMAILYYVKTICGRRSLRVPSLLCLMNQLRGERRRRKSKKNNNTTTTNKRKEINHKPVKTWRNLRPECMEVYFSAWF